MALPCTSSATKIRFCILLVLMSITGAFSIPEKRLSMSLPRMRRSLELDHEEISPSNSYDKYDFEKKRKNRAAVRGYYSGKYGSD